MPNTVMLQSKTKELTTMSATIQQMTV